MTTFDKREDAFEREFAHDEDLKFRAKARRDHLLGLWAAGKLGLAGPAAEAYSKDLIVSDVETHDILERVSMDFVAKGVMESEEQIRQAATQFMARAMVEVRAGR